MDKEERKQSMKQCFDELKAHGMFLAFKTYEEWEANQRRIEESKHSDE